MKSAKIIKQWMKKNPIKNTPAKIAVILDLYSSQRVERWLDRNSIPDGFYLILKRILK